MYKIIVRGVAACSAAAALMGTALAQAPTAPETYPYGPHMGWWGGGWDGMFFGPLFMLLVVAAVVVTVVLLVRRPGATWPRAARHPQRALRPR